MSHPKPIIVNYDFVEWYAKECTVSSNDVIADLKKMQMYDQELLYAVYKTYCAGKSLPILEKKHSALCRVCDMQGSKNVLFNATHNKTAILCSAHQKICMSMGSSECEPSTLRTSDVLYASSNTSAKPQKNEYINPQPWRSDPSELLIPWKRA